MSDFVVSARKYRPAKFDSVVGQPSVTNTLKNAINTGHVAHAYLFCGPRGVGKTTCARIFAKTLNCFNYSPETEACDECESCKAFNESRSFNIHELDAASNNSVDDIRSLIDKVRIMPQIGKYSIYIIDEVHMLSQAAFNAFLKTLEEPPAHAIFILATTEKHKIIPTILSRCQIFDFNRIRVEDMVGYLAGIAKKENVAYEEEALTVIALKADGALRDALSIFDQVASFSSGNITYKEVIENLNVLDYEYYFRFTEAFLNKETTKALLLFDEILQKGFDGQNLIGGLASHLRDLLVCTDEVTVPLLEVSDSIRAKYKQQAKLCTTDFLFPALEICNQCEVYYKSSKNQRLHIELALIKLSNIQGEKKKLRDKLEEFVIPDIAAAKDAPKVTSDKNIPKPAASVPRSVLKEPDARYNSFPNISIKDALKKAETVPDEEEINDAIGDENLIENNSSASESNVISPQFLTLCLNAFADQIHMDKPRMAVFLKNPQAKILPDNKIGFTLNNQTQFDDFNTNLREDLKKFLRRELHNSLLEIDTEIAESAEDNQVKFYTSEEKFQYLSKKNPLLAKLRQNLNLELE